MLGSTGRNFGAGMSGGIAYVYDVDDRFASLVNYEMVTVEDLDDIDRDFLRTTITRHRDFTGSMVAELVLADWDTEVTRFRKVMPTDYKRVLDVIAQSKAEGLDEAQTVDRIMEAARMTMKPTSGVRNHSERAAREAPATSRSPIEENRRADEEDTNNGQADGISGVVAGDAAATAGAGATPRLA